LVKTRVLKIKDNLYMLRIDDDEVKYFEGLWWIPEGITYNAYLLTTSEGDVLFDTWKHKYSDLFIEELRRITDLKNIRYLVVHHMEPDHSGSLPAVLRINPEITVLGHALAKGMIESFYNIKPKYRVVKDGEILGIGDYRIRFIYTPWLHWPETIISYIENYKILLTCDAFGSYGIFDKIYDEELGKNELEKYMFYTRKYIATVIGHYADWVGKALEKIEKLGIGIEIIAPAHGILWKKPENIMKYYRAWSKGTSVSGVKKIVVLYTSMYGFVERAVNEAIEVLKKKNAYFKIYRFVDNYRDNISDLLSDLLNASAIIIGTATYEADVYPFMKHILDLVIEKIPRNKKILVITNYGWGGVAGRKLREMLSKNGFEIVDVVEFRAGQIDKYREKIISSVEKLLESIGAGS
jgi:flavorubredoxin